MPAQLERQLHYRRPGSTKRKGFALDRQEASRPRMSEPTRWVGTRVAIASQAIVTMRRLFTVSAIIYVLLYACEGAVRYGLYSIGRDDAILLRDLLLVCPLALLFAAQAVAGSGASGVFAFAAVSRCTARSPRSISAVTCPRSTVRSCW